MSRKHPLTTLMSGRLTAVIGNAAAISSGRALAGLPVLGTVPINRDGAGITAADPECVLATGTIVVRRSAVVAVCAVTILLRKAFTDSTILATARSVSRDSAGTGVVHAESALAAGWLWYMQLDYSSS